MIEVIKSAARKMLIDFEDTRSISHNPTKGRAREYFVIESFLKPYLPARYSIGSGIIIDAERKDSRQQDLVIYDRFYSPVLLDVESDKIFFPESVFVTIEVKSNLGTAELRDMVNKSASVWALSKTPSPQIALSPGAILPSQHYPTLCAGMCFESSLAIEDMPAKVRETRTSIENGHALSIICILKDRNGKSGVILNVSEENLGVVQLIPSASTRLAVVECDTEGDALLYTYLMLMEHLKYSGAITPGPNLIYYAEAGGLGTKNLSVSRDEVKGTSVEAEGQRVEMDIAIHMGELTKKILGDRNATEEEILEWFYYIPQMPSGESLLHPRSIFVVDGTPSDLPSTRAIHEAIVRRRNHKPIEGDEDLLKRFVALIRSVGTDDKKIWMGTM